MPPLLRLLCPPYAVTNDQHATPYYGYYATPYYGYYAVTEACICCPVMRRAGGFLGLKHCQTFMWTKRVAPVSGGYDEEYAECEEVDRVPARVGEAVCVCVLHQACGRCLDAPPDPTHTWTRHGPPLTHTHTHTHTQRIHTHGTALLFLPLTHNDSGLYYYSTHRPGEKYQCVEVIAKNVPLGHPDILYYMAPLQPPNLIISCAPEAFYLCQGRGHITWYKDSQLLPGQSGKDLRLLDANQSDEGIYSCVCTWHHGNHTFNTSASKRLQLTAGVSVRHPPTIRYPLNGSTLTCCLGCPVNLTCRASCGINVTQHCKVTWDTQTHTRNHSQLLTWQQSGGECVFEAVLIISSVSHEDLHTHFRCEANNYIAWTSVIVTLQQEESLLWVVVCVCVCVLLMVLLVAVVVKRFAIDLALHLRPARTTEDQVEQVERSMRLSRRLLVVMTTAGSRGGQEEAPPLEEFDWQMGVHTALVQGSMSVIMVQAVPGAKRM
ncbi:hypothetical protein ACEWY4_027436 [Coilia grayii]|uniref:Ig-like domain-containing protein n=1 Tax=Coilia grayii TaxID=363190 RepID=A0ABD1IQ77_9TELE